LLGTPVLVLRGLHDVWLPHDSIGRRANGLRREDAVRCDQRDTAARGRERGVPRVMQRAHGVALTLVINESVLDRNPRASVLLVLIVDRCRILLEVEVAAA